MTVQAHDVRYVNHAATKRPTAYVRTVQEKRRPLGWLECTADEFMRLLALHNKGEINLLAMPEYASDPVADESEADADEAPEPTSRAGAGPQSMTVPALIRVRQAMRHITQPTPTAVIASRSGLTKQSAAYILRTHPGEFTCVGQEGRENLWMRRGQ